MAKSGVGTMFGLIILRQERGMTNSYITMYATVLLF